MSLGAIFSAGLSGLQAAQAGLRTASQNVSNVNTVGYARVDASFEAVQGGGVAVTGVHRVVDAYLTGASLSSSAASAGGQTLADMLDRAQSAFGDPNSDTSLFAKLSGVFYKLQRAGVRSVQRHSQDDGGGLGAVAAFGI
ncbi:MAG: flagellar basal body protein [Alphaproteobacteria bacterium]